MGFWLVGIARDLGQTVQPSLELWPSNEQAQERGRYDTQSVRSRVAISRPATERVCRGD